MTVTAFPKIIWQTHKWEYKDLPEIYKKTSKTWQVMNPDWEYRYVPNDQMRQYLEHLDSPALLRFFDSKQDILTKSDIWREAMVYEYGGLWADLDSVCMFPIDRIVEKNKDKEMICSYPFPKFQMDENNNYSGLGLEESLQRLLSGKEFGYWIPNSGFLGKKHNKVSEEIMKAMTENWTFREPSFMGLRAELYEKYHDLMSLDLLCLFHDGRFNDRNYSNTPEI